MCNISWSALYWNLHRFANYNLNVGISIQISLKFVPWCSDDGLAQTRRQTIIWTKDGIVYWRICVTRPQWVRWCHFLHMTQRKMAYASVNSCRLYFILVHIDVMLWHMKMDVSCFLTLRWHMWLISYLFIRHRQYYGCWLPGDTVRHQRSWYLPI